VLTEMTTSFVQLQASNKAIEHNTTVIVDNMSARWKTELLDRICSINYRQQHRDAIIRHQHGTGEWFLDEPKYQAWASSSRGTLVCPGVPGAGKTMMAALVVEQQIRAAQPSTETIAFIYYSYKRQDQQTLRHTIETIIRQIVDILPDTPTLVNAFLDPTYVPSIKKLTEILHELLEPFSGLTIVTDALDECRDGTRNDILSWIADLQTKASVRYLATTRDFYSNSSQSVFRDKPCLEIKASKHDLEVYARSRAQSLRARIQPDLLEDLVGGVVTAADGM